MKYDDIRTAKRVQAPNGEKGRVLSWGSDWVPEGKQRPPRWESKARVQFDDGTEAEVLISDLERLDE